MRTSQWQKRKIQSVRFRLSKKIYQMEIFMSTKEEDWINNRLWCCNLQSQKVSICILYLIRPTKNSWNSIIKSLSPVESESTLKNRDSHRLNSASVNLCRPKTLLWHLAQGRGSNSLLYLVEPLLSWLQVILDHILTSLALTCMAQLTLP